MTVRPAGGLDANESSATRNAAVRLLAGRLATRAEASVAAHTPILVLGGDHSIAMGTWAGAAQALRPRGPLGLVWIDAHMDAHTPATTPSGNWHGMPVAHLLGECEPEMADMAVCTGAAPALRPQHVCLVGPRSFEPQEAARLSRLGVRVIDHVEIQRIGLATAIETATAIASTGTAGFGVSLDLDVIDPTQAPGVGTAEPGGVDAIELTRALRGLAEQPGFVGLEIVEFNPALDVEGRTARVALDLVASALRRSVRSGRSACPRVRQKRPRAVIPA